MNGPDRSVQLTVIIPCRDEERLLPRQLQALVEQDWDSTWEIVLADNGSTDASVDVAHRAVPSSIDLVVVDAADRPGRQHACNAGARAARGDLLVFVDADDVVAPGYLRAMAMGLERWPVVGASIDHQSLSNGWVLEAASDAQTHALQCAHRYLPFASGGAFGIRRAVFLDLEGFREVYRYAEDIDLCWRAQLAGHEIGFVPGAVLRYQYREDLRSMYRQHRGFGRGSALLYRDYRDLGMPRRTSRDALVEWAQIARGLFTIAEPGTRARWLRRLGRSVGRLQGSARYRVWYP